MLLVCVRVCARWRAYVHGNVCTQNIMCTLIKYTYFNIFSPDLIRTKYVWVYEGAFVVAVGFLYTSKKSDDVDDDELQ